jgi:hypothetical protein
MEKTDSSQEQSHLDFYLPGMPRATTEAGRVERFVRNLLRQRGKYRVRLTRKGR